MVHPESAPVPEVPRTQIPEIDRWIDLEERYDELTIAELWTVGSGALEGGRGSVHHLVVSGDGSTMIVTDSDLMWSVDTRSMTARRVEPAPDDVRAIALDDLARSLLVVDGTNLVKFSRTADGSWTGAETIASAPSFDDSYLLRVNAAGTIAVVAQRDSSSLMHVVDVAAKEISFTRTISCADGLLLHPSGQVLISQSDASITILNSQGNTSRLQGWAVALSRDGNTLAVAEVGTLHLYRLDASGAVARTPFQMSTGDEASPFQSIAFSPDGSFVAGCDGSLIQLMELAAPNRRLTVGEGDYSTDLGVLADGRVAWTYDAGVRICTRSGAQLGTISPAGSGTEALIGEISLGIYGAIDGARPANPPHERPRVVSAVLGGTGLDQRESLLYSELATRARLVNELLAHKTADATPDRLVALAAGIVGLLPELLFRAEASLAARPAFGQQQLRVADLEAIAEELRGLTSSQRRLTLSAMVQRMAAEAARRQAAAQARQRAVEEHQSRLSSRIRSAPKLFGALAALILGAVAFAVVGASSSPGFGIVLLLFGLGIGLPFVYMGTAALINSSASFRYAEYSTSTGYVDGQSVRISKRTGTGTAQLTPKNATIMLVLGLACVSGGVWGGLALSDDSADTGPRPALTPEAPISPGDAPGR